MSPFSSPPSLISCLAPSRPDADLTNERRNPRLFLHHSIQQAVTISGATIDHAVIPYPALRPGGGAAVARGSFVVPFCYSMKGLNYSSKVSEANGDRKLDATRFIHDAFASLGKET
ncbi:uncharacterized protein LOC123401390 [Hordeum vulgare subsp. vulgare]|uniref:uncharacterized protein LOC123401390 n=1 Tax=Hordeum vulgare subsp. vulgare TaxID=112509 RepID=UPI001D1A3480|nr:uncharacterized protein LOC123401390 [Hordeum vulgare subsp. vulgare]